jgi:hypothetical protein
MLQRHVAELQTQNILLQQALRRQLDLQLDHQLDNGKSTSMSSDPFSFSPRMASIQLPAVYAY